MLPQNSDVPNDTFNNFQNNDENVVNIKTTYDVKNAETVNNTSDNGDDIEDENIENVEDSDNYNPQDIFQIQQKTNSNPITNNNMLPWYEQIFESEQLEQEIDLPSEKIYGIIN